MVRRAVWVPVTGGECFFWGPVIFFRGGNASVFGWVAVERFLIRVVGVEGVWDVVR